MVSVCRCFAALCLPARPGHCGLGGDASGGLAQLARAPALQAGGQRFESVILHISHPAMAAAVWESIFDLLAHKTVVKTKRNEATTVQSAWHCPSAGGMLSPFPAMLGRAFYRTVERVASEVCQGARWMPWLTEAMKDVISCDKPGRGANGHRPRDFRMGQPTALVPYPATAGG